MRTALVSTAIVAVLFTVSAARADGPAPPATAKDARASAAVEAPAEAAKPTPEPYVPPFELRGVGPGNSVRLDTTVAPLTDPKTHLGQTETVSLFSASARIAEEFALNARIGVVRNDHPNPSSGIAANGVTNALIGGMWGTTFASYWRVSASAGVGLPTGSGGGNTPDPDRAAAMKAGAMARAAMDNAMFSVNDVAMPIGLDAAYVRRGLTAQVEASITPLVRARGEQKSPDASKVNSTFGLFVGYFILPRQLSLGAEAHYQRYLSTPDAVSKDPSLRDNLTAGSGVRGYFALAQNVTFKPGLSYGTGIEGAIADRHYQMVQVDLPISF